LALRVQNSDVSKVARELGVTRAVLYGHLKRNEAYLNEQKNLQ
jgi:transcriptional regulator of acetoin/glycerol metabolism